MGIVPYGGERGCGRRGVEDVAPYDGERGCGNKNRVLPKGNTLFIYQITTRLEGERYIPSVFFTPKVSYHSGKLRGGIFARR